MLISFITILLAMALYGLVHSLLASHGLKCWVHARCGPSVMRYYRLGYNLFAVISLLPVLALARLLPDASLYTIPMPGALAALGIQGLAALTAAVAVLQTGAWSFLGFSPNAPLPPCSEPSYVVPSKMVTNGLYRHVRHPIYTAGLIFLWFTPVMTLNLLALYLGFSLYLIAGAYVEERKLLVEFGQAYREYQRRTPMFVPGMRRRAK